MESSWIAVVCVLLLGLMQSSLGAEQRVIPPGKPVSVQHSPLTPLAGTPLAKCIDPVILTLSDSDGGESGQQVAGPCIRPCMYNSNQPGRQGPELGGPAG